MARIVRRRCPLARERAELFAPISKPNSQYDRPAIGKRLAHQAKREDVAEHSPALRVRKAIEVEVALIAHDDQLLGEIELSLTRSAKPDEVRTFARLRSVPGIGQLLAPVLLSEIHDIRRFPRVQAAVSWCRLVKGAKESNGKRLGTAGKTIGNGHLAGPLPKPRPSSSASVSPAKRIWRSRNTNTAKPRPSRASAPQS